MAANLQTYALLYVGINGALLSEETRAQFKRASAGQIVKTVAKGLAGVSPGAALCTGGFSSVVPGSGLEYDAGQVIITLKPVTLKMVQSSGQIANIQAILLDDEMMHGVDQEAKYDINFVGTFPSWSALP